VLTKSALPLHLKEETEWNKVARKPGYRKKRIVTLLCFELLREKCHLKQYCFQELLTILSKLLLDLRLNGKKRQIFVFCEFHLFFLVHCMQDYLSLYYVSGSRRQIFSAEYTAKKTTANIIYCAVRYTSVQ